MAVNSTGNNNAGQTQQQQQPTSMGQAFAQAGTEQQIPPRVKWSNMGSLTRTAMGRKPASECLVKAQKAIGDLYAKRNDPIFKVSLLAIDMANNQELAISALVVVTQDEGNPKAGLAYHTFILEGSAEVPPPKYDNINGRQVEVLRVPGDSNDKILHGVIRAKLMAAYPNTTLHNADACVIPRDFNFADEVATTMLAANGLLATTTELEIKHPNFRDLNLSYIDNDSNLTVRPTFAGDQITGVDGLPIRSSVIIDFSATVQQNQQQQQSADRVTSLAQIAGFVDLAWDPVQGPVNAWVAQAQNQQAINQSYVKYTARYVMTALESQELLTIPAQLLAMLPALTLRENNSWANAFRPAPFSNGIDKSDIGAIGLEVNFDNNPTGVGTRIDTKSASFTDQSLFQLLAATTRPGMVLMLDVPKCGGSTWYTNVFAAESEGDLQARQAILNAAETLTNGNFGKYYKSNGPICDNENNIIHMGYYEVNGVRHDIRELDYLAILNMVGEQDMGIVTKFCNTYLDRSTPINQRLSDRKQIYAHLVSNLVITGKALRLSISAEFLDALAKGAQDCGLAIRLANQFQDQALFERSSAGYGQQNIMSSDSVGIFNRSSAINTNVGNRNGGGYNRSW
jgi:hypothetical protein